MSNFRERLLRGDLLLGCMVTLDSPAIVEMLSELGFDWLFIETEHAPLSPQAVQHLIRIAGNTPALVRLAEGDEISIKRALDAGAAGIIVPQVNSVAQARRIVQHAKYPPLGQRGIGLCRASGYGMRFEEYIACANDTTAVIVQAEHIDAVAAIDDIARVPGLDGIFVGPYDLSASMNQTGRLDAPEVVAAIAAVRDAALAANRCLGYYSAAASVIAARVAEGYTLLCCGADVSIFAAGARQLLDALRPKGV